MKQQEAIRKQDGYSREVTRQDKCCLHHIFSSVPNNVSYDDTCIAEPAIEHCCIKL